MPYLDDNSTTAEGPSCSNCTVHAGFLASWQNTRDAILEDVQQALNDHQDHRVVLVGHSLGGAVALLAALEFSARGWEPQVTTFGEPKVGNEGFVKHVDQLFPEDEANYRRITHVDDPVPLLPLTEWGYRSHAGELFISKPDLPPDISNVRKCIGDADESCSAGADDSVIATTSTEEMEDMEQEGAEEWQAWVSKRWDMVPTRLKLWQLFFSHRDYFWRLGLCVTGGDPWDWKGHYEDGHGQFDEL